MYDLFLWSVAIYLLGAFITLGVGAYMATKLEEGVPRADEKELREAMLTSVFWPIVLYFFLIGLLVKIFKK